MIVRLMLMLGLLMGIALVSASAADLQLEAKLIWGSNDPADKIKHKTIEDQKLSSTLHNNFKWANYFEITNKAIAIPQDKVGTLQMSEKCKLEVKNLGSSRIEVKCIGNGKTVSKGQHSLPPGKWVALGGSDKNHTAWFIALKSK
jgi:hypothetical protein